MVHLLHEKKRKLDSAEIEKFVADIRAFLDSELGEPRDSSSDGLTGRSISLKWQAETTDEQPHQAGVELYMSSGITNWQEVKWIDYEREKALNAAIELEKNKRIREKGL